MAFLQTKGISLDLVEAAMLIPFPPLPSKKWIVNAPKMVMHTGDLIKYEVDSWFKLSNRLFVWKKKCGTSRKYPYPTLGKA